VGENNAPRGGGGGTPAAGFWAIPTGGRHSPARPHRAPFASSPPKRPAGPCAKPPRGRGGSPASGPAAPGLEGSRAASSRLPGGHTSHICHNLRHLNYKKIAVRADQAPSSPRRSAFRTAPQGWRESPWAPAARWRSAKARRNRNCDAVRYGLGRKLPHCVLWEWRETAKETSQNGGGAVWAAAGQDVWPPDPHTHSDRT